MRGGPHYAKGSISGGNGHQMLGYDHRPPYTRRSGRRWWRDRELNPVSSDNESDGLPFAFPAGSGYHGRETIPGLTGTEYPYFLYAGAGRYMAEGVGLEPTEPLRGSRVSNPSQ